MGRHCFSFSGVQRLIPRLLWISVGVLFLPARAFALQEYYDLQRSARALGMGNAYYALSDDAYALFYNPAGLGFSKRTLAIMLVPSLTTDFTSFQFVEKVASLNSAPLTQTISTLEQFQGQPLNTQVALTTPLIQWNHFAGALMLGNLQINSALLGQNLDSTYDVTAFYDAGLLLGYGQRVFDPHLSLGINMKLLYRAGGRAYLSTTNFQQLQNAFATPAQFGGSGAGIDFDVGAIYQLPTPLLGRENRIGLTLTNILATPYPWFRDSGNPPQLCRMLSLGSMTVWDGAWIFDEFRLLADIQQVGLGGQPSLDLGGRGGVFWKHIDIGLEVPLRHVLLARVGLHQGNWSGGLGVESPFARLEIATFAEELDGGVGRLSSRRFAFQLFVGFGKGATAATPLSETTPLPKLEEVADKPQPQHSRTEGVSVR